MTTLREFSQRGYLHFLASGETVVDADGREIVRASVDLRTGRYSALVTWHEGGFLKRDVIVVTGDYPVTVKVKGN